MIDIDYFKLFNDTYGHLEGDICLQKVAQTVSDTVKRPKDAVIRFGGEEFLVVLPYIDHQGTKLVAHQLVEAVAHAKIPHGKGIENRVSISAGFAVWKATDVVEEDVRAYRRRDISLFEAKELGRNQTKAEATVKPHHKNRFLAYCLISRIQIQAIIINAGPLCMNRARRQESCGLYAWVANHGLF